MKKIVAFFAMVLLCVVAHAEIVDHTGGALNGYQMVYQLNIPTTADYSSAQPVYAVNNSAQNFGMVESLGYYMVLDYNWVFASMSPFTLNQNQMGVPTVQSGAAFQQYVKNLYYKSNVTSLNAADGKSVGQGNIEFWPGNYNGANTKGIPNAKGGDGEFDFGDGNYGTPKGYGSMQIHDYQNQTTVLAFNRWGDQTPNVDVGIGNGSGHADWTFSENGANYTNRQLGVYVKPVDFSAATGTQAQVIANETADMNLVYRYDIDTTESGSRVTTTIDNTAASSSLKGMPLARTAYFYQLTKNDNTVDYAYVSFDSLTNNVAKLGIPENYNFQWASKVGNMTVQSNVAGVTNGTGIQTGNVEIWSNDYSTGTGSVVPGGNGGSYDFSDTINTNANQGQYGSFQIHNYGEGKTIMALNNSRTNNNACVGIGSQAEGDPDWTFKNNANQYKSVSLHVMAEAAIAPGMANVADGADYSVVQGARMSQQQTVPWGNGGLKYDIVDNVAELQGNGKYFDRIGYYIEYAQTADSPLKYAFVSMDAFTQDVSKIGVPTVGSGIFYQQTVKNLQVTSNVDASESTITSGNFNRGYLEFWEYNYSQAKGGIIGEGDGGTYDINDSCSWSDTHGSMQVHNLDTGETVFAVNNFESTDGKSIGIGTNIHLTGNEAPDWTFTNKKNYEIANIYSFVRESEALLTTDGAASGFQMYQRSRSEGTAIVDVTGTWKATSASNFDKIQLSEDGTTWVDATVKDDGTYSAALKLDSGWHTLKVQAVDNTGNVLTSTTTDKIGVGEIFITAGQSNSTNCGDAPMPSTSGNVLALNHTTGQWGIANDPQPVTINNSGDGSGRGSTWSSMGDVLSEQLGVPVGIVSVGWSGSNIGQWKPGNVDTTAEGWDEVAFSAGEKTLYGRLAYAIQELDGEFAGVLWHQGESDAGNSKDYYATSLEELIEASRDFADWEVPWSVALVSYRPGAGVDSNIVDAQLQVIEEMDGVYLGPDSDALLGEFRGTNGNNIHFSTIGLAELGKLWSASAGQMGTLVPEPATYGMFLLGTIFLGLFRFYGKKRRNAA